MIESGSKIEKLYHKILSLISKMLQLIDIHSEFDSLQSTYWETNLNSVYGAGCISNPKLCLIFMNPTAKNIACLPDWEWIRAPWIWFKQTRKMIHDLWLISDDIFIKTQWSLTQRSPAFVKELYEHLAVRWIYITNLAKCTQADAKALPNSVFKAYMPSIYKEIWLLQPQHIITFWNQVSSILLDRQVNVSAYENDTHEVLKVWELEYKIYPCRYPVGMWYRNIEKAKKRITAIL